MTSLIPLKVLNYLVFSVLPQHRDPTFLQMVVLCVGGEDYII
jgi:hypothetical protein